MKTELSIQPAQITPGKKIQVIEHNVRNFRMHLALEHLSRMQIGFIENDSGNMTGTLVPENVQDAWSQFKLIKSELDFAKKHNNPPLADHEEAYKILLLKGSEVQAMQNVKQKRVVKELDRLAHIMLSVDSAKAQGNISDADFAKIDIQYKTVEDAMKIWMGMGVDNSDTGISTPSFTHLGVLEPSVDLDYSETIEPSKDLPSPHLPDAPDQ